MQKSRIPVVESKGTKIAKIILLVLLSVFSGVSVIFSLYVLFGDFGGSREISPAQARGLFTVFIYENINEVHPDALPSGSTWQITGLEFPNKNFAIVDAASGQTRSRLEFIYTIEYPNVRVLKINDITGRDVQDANFALIRFLDFLKTGDYENAAVLYSGPVARLVPYGTETDPLPKLLRGYCEKTTPVGRCLDFTISDAHKDPETALYRFRVTYRLPDGSGFALPDGTSSFLATLESSNGITFRVTSLPFDQ